MEEIFLGYRRMRFGVAIAITLVALGCAGSIYYTWHEGHARTNAICKLTIARQNDNVKNYKQTVKFLATPAGRENTGLNAAIRKNLPTQKHQIETGVREIPTYCKMAYPPLSLD